MRVLVRRATHADIGQGRVLKAVLKTHRNLNSRPKSPISTRKYAASASLLCLQPQKLVERKRGESACNTAIFSIVTGMIGSYTPGPHGWRLALHGSCRTISAAQRPLAHCVSGC